MSGEENQPPIRVSIGDRRYASAKQDWPFLRVFDLKALQDITEELSRAREKHPSFPTIHHALSVIREEYKELEEVAFMDGIDAANPDDVLGYEIHRRLYDHMKKEAIQLATTCIRLLVEL